MPVTGFGLAVPYERLKEEVNSKQVKMQSYLVQEEALKFYNSVRTVLV